MIFLLSGFTNLPIPTPSWVIRIMFEKEKNEGKCFIGFSSEAPRVINDDFHGHSQLLSDWSSMSGK
jgi:hypothetical protein